MEELRSILLRELDLVVRPLGLQVVELSVYRGKSGLNIRAVVYREGGVTLDDCERVTRLFNDRLTILEPIDENNYTLQVSSPGIERVFKDLKEYDIFRSRYVKMVVDSSIEESEGGVIKGILEGLDHDHVKLRTDGKPEKLLRIPLESIRKVRLNG
jgi:ribosome maturation factor RimP